MTKQELLKIRSLQKFFKDLTKNATTPICPYCTSKGFNECMYTDSPVKCQFRDCDSVAVNVIKTAMTRSEYE